jgi:hypothetical protein
VGSTRIRLSSGSVAVAAVRNASASACSAAGSPGGGVAISWIIDRVTDTSLTGLSSVSARPKRCRIVVTCARSSLAIVGPVQLVERRGVGAELGEPRSIHPLVHCGGSWSARGGAVARGLVPCAADAPYLIGQLPRCAVLATHGAPPSFAALPPTL